MRRVKCLLCVGHSDSDIGYVKCPRARCGLPVVLYDNLVVNDVYCKCRSIIRVPKGDIEAFANQILDLMKNQKHLSKLSEFSKEDAEQFSWEQLMQRYIHILQICIKGNARPRMRLALLFAFKRQHEIMTKILRWVVSFGLC
jgi:glycosyltransferase involved in cell wall biosynthesis